MELSLVFGVLEQGLKLLNTERGNHLLNKVIGLKKDYYEQLSLEESIRSQLALDTIVLELNIIAKEFVTYSPKK